MYLITIMYRFQVKKGFRTKKQARKQEIAVILKQPKRQHKPLEYYFG